MTARFRTMYRPSFASNVNHARQYSMTSSREVGRVVLHQLCHALLTLLCSVLLADLVHQLVKGTPMATSVPRLNSIAFYPVKFIFWISKISYCLILLGLLYFAVFSILVTNRNVSRALFGRDGNYSDYLLEKYVMNAEQIKSCLVDFQVCPNIPTGKGAEFYKYSLSPAQLSCCILPAQCTLVLQNDTYWIMPKAGPAVANNDSKNWSTVESELCFNCQSCKTASYDIIKKHWKITSFIILFIVFVCCVDFCALKIKNRSKGPQRNKVYPV